MSVHKANYFEYLAKEDDGKTSCRVSVDLHALPFIVFAFAQLSQIMACASLLNSISSELRAEALKLVSSCKTVAQKIQENNINIFSEHMDPELRQQSAYMVDIEFWKNIESKIESYNVAE